MKLAVSNIAWSPAERLQAYTAMAVAGFTGLEIAPGLFFHASEDPFMPDEASADKALAEMADFGLELVSMQSLLFGVEGAGLFDGDEARGRLVSGMYRAIDLAGRFSIPNLVFGSPAQRRVPADMAMDRALDEAVVVFQSLGDRAAEAGTCITIEANPAAYGTNFLNTLEDAMGFVERVDHPAIATILDLGAMHMNDQFEAVPGHVNALMPGLNHVHVSEPELAPAPADLEAIAPVLETLLECGYTKAVSIEMRRPDIGISGVKSCISALAKAALDAGQMREAAHA